MSLTDDRSSQINHTTLHMKLVGSSQSLSHTAYQVRITKAYVVMIQNLRVPYSDSQFKMTVYFGKLSKNLSYSGRKSLNKGIKSTSSGVSSGQKCDLISVCRS